MGMQPHRPHKSDGSTSQDSRAARNKSFTVRTCLLAGLGTVIALLLIQRTGPRLQNSDSAMDEQSSKLEKSPPTLPGASGKTGTTAAASTQSAADQVARKLALFSSSRLGIARFLARKSGHELPPDAERFFELAEANRWSDLKDLFLRLKELRFSGEAPPGLESAWHALFETYGTAEASNEWKPERLLDYGNAILESLKPGMVYLGGTDAGRFIPTLLNVTPDGDRNIVITQNSLADSSYLEYIREVHGHRFSPLTAADSEQAFAGYIEDARRRLLHDQQFPDEPKQVRPGEDIRMEQGKVIVSGQLAVMSINERLVQTLIANNPGLAFAMEESFPLASVQAGAVPLGPILELKSGDQSHPLSSEQAAASIEQWRGKVDGLLGDPDAAGTLAAYSKLVVGHAGLFLQQKLGSEADQAFRLAVQLTPSNTEAVTRYAMFLSDQARLPEAQAIVQRAVQLDPSNETFRSLLGALNSQAPNPPSAQR